MDNHSGLTTSHMQCYINTVAGDVAFSGAKFGKFNVNIYGSNKVSVDSTTELSYGLNTDRCTFNVGRNTSDGDDTNSLLELTAANAHKRKIYGAGKSTLKQLCAKVNITNKIPTNALYSDSGNVEDTDLKETKTTGKTIVEMSETTPNTWNFEGKLPHTELEIKGQGNNDYRLHVKNSDVIFNTDSNKALTIAEKVTFSGDTQHYHNKSIIVNGILNMDKLEDKDDAILNKITKGDESSTSPADISLSATQNDTLDITGKFPAATFKLNSHSSSHVINLALSNTITTDKKMSVNNLTRITTNRLAIHGKTISDQTSGAMITLNEDISDLDGSKIDTNITLYTGNNTFTGDLKTGTTHTLPASAVLALDINKAETITFTGAGTTNINGLNNTSQLQHFNTTVVNISVNENITFTGTFPSDTSNVSTTTTVINGKRMTLTATKANGEVILGDGSVTVTATASELQSKILNNISTSALGSSNKLELSQNASTNSVTRLLNTPFSLFGNKTLNISSINNIITAHTVTVLQNNVISGNASTLTGKTIIGNGTSNITDLENNSVLANINTAVVNISVNENITFTGTFPSDTSNVSTTTTVINGKRMTLTATKANGEVITGSGSVIVTTTASELNDKILNNITTTSATNGSSNKLQMSEDATTNSATRLLDTTFSLDGGSSNNEKTLTVVHIDNILTAHTVTVPLYHKLIGNASSLTGKSTNGEGKVEINNLEAASALTNIVTDEVDIKVSDNITFTGTFPNTLKGVVTTTTVEENIRMTLTATKADTETITGKGSVTILVTSEDELYGKVLNNIDTSGDNGHNNILNLDQDSSTNSTTKFLNEEFTLIGNKILTAISSNNFITNHIVTLNSGNRIKGASGVLSGKYISGTGTTEITTAINNQQNYSNLNNTVVIFDVGGVASTTASHIPPSVQTNAELQMTSAVATGKTIGGSANVRITDAITSSQNFSGLTSGQTIFNVGGVASTTASHIPTSTETNGELQITSAVATGKTIGGSDNVRITDAITSSQNFSGLTSGQTIFNLGGVASSVIGTGNALFINTIELYKDTQVNKSGDPAYISGIIFNYTNGTSTSQKFSYNSSGIIDIDFNQGTQNVTGGGNNMPSSNNGSKTELEVNQLAKTYGYVNFSTNLGTQRTYHLITFENGEVITAINQRSGSWLDAIQFVTNKKTTTDIGGSGGGASTLTAPSGEHIVELTRGNGTWVRDWIKKIVAITTESTSVPVSSYIPTSIQTNAELQMIAAVATGKTIGGSGNVKITDNITVSQDFTNLTSGQVIFETGGTASETPSKIPVISVNNGTLNINALVANGKTITGTGTTNIENLHLDQDADLDNIKTDTVNVNISSDTTMLSSGKLPTNQSSTRETIVASGKTFTLPAAIANSQKITGNGTVIVQATQSPDANDYSLIDPTTPIIEFSENTTFTGTFSNSRVNQMTIKLAEDKTFELDCSKAYEGKLKFENNGSGPNTNTKLIININNKNADKDNDLTDTNVIDYKDVQNVEIIINESVQLGSNAKFFDTTNAMSGNDKGGWVPSKRGRENIQNNDGPWVGRIVKIPNASSTLTALSTQLDKQPIGDGSTSGELKIEQIENSQYFDDSNYNLNNAQYYVRSANTQANCLKYESSSTKLTSGAGSYKGQSYGMFTGRYYSSPGLYLMESGNDIALQFYISQNIVKNAPKSGSRTRFTVHGSDSDALETYDRLNIVKDENCITTGKGSFLEAGKYNLWVNEFKGSGAIPVTQYAASHTYGNGAGFYISAKSSWTTQTSGALNTFIDVDP
jgi:hypothetical protein